MILSVRPAVPDDLAVVLQIVQAAYSPYVTRIGAKPGPMLDDYASLIGEDRMYVAERDGRVQGFLVLIPEYDSMLLDNIAVVPEAQGVGLGRLMLERAERTAIEAGYDSIKLYTNEAMTENIALYARIGYAETHRAYEKGLRRVYMRKPLGKVRANLTM